MKHSVRILGLVALAAMAPGLAHAAACSTALSGNWQDAGTWSAPCNGLPGGPGAADTVTIGATHNVTLTGPAAAASLTITGATSAVPNGGRNGLDLAGHALTVGGPITIGTPASSATGRTSGIVVGNGALTAASISVGGLTNRISSITTDAGNINVGGNFTHTGSTAYSRFTSTGASAITVSGNFTGGTKSLGASTVNVGGNFSGGTLTAGTSTVNFNGSGPQSMGGYTYYNVTINKGSGSSATSTGTTTIGGTLSVASGTLNIAGYTFTVTGPTIVSGSLIHSSTAGTKTHNGDVIINSAGTWQETAAEAIIFRGNLQNGGTFAALGGAHTFAGTNKAFIGTLSIPYVSLTGSYTNSDTLTISATFSGAGTLTNAANAALNIGSTTVAPTLALAASGNTVNYIRAGNQTVRSATYRNLVLKGSGVKSVATSTINGDFGMSENATATATGNLTFNGSVTIGATNVFNGGARTLTLSGNFSNNGTLNPGTGTFVLAGGAAQTLGGNSALGFYNLTINKTGSTATLLKNATVSYVLRLTGGTITTGENTLISSRSDCLSAVPRTGGHVVGNLQITFPTTNNRTCTFPVGDARGYAPIAFTKSGTSSGTVTGRVDGGDHPDASIDVGIDPAQNANHYWTLTTGTLPGTTTYSAVFQFCANTAACQIGTDKELDPDATTGSFIVREKSGGSWATKTVGTKRAYSTQARNLAGSGTFVVGEPYTAPYDHIGIFLPGSSSCLGAVAATIKACLDSGCSSVYTGTSTVNLSASGNASWAASNPVELTNGTRTIDLVDNTAQSVSLDATGNAPLPAASVQCYHGGTAASCTDVLTYSSCSFNAFEPGNPRNENPIYTKLANLGFTLTVSSPSGKVANLDSVDVVDASSDTCGSTVLSSGGSLSFASGETTKDVVFTVTNAASDARVRMTYGTQSACSSDNFAIRPALFSLATTATNSAGNGEPVFAAGNTPFTITATAVSSLSPFTPVSGYNGTPRINAGALSVPTGLEMGTLQRATDSTTPPVFPQADGTIARGDFLYSEVGSFNLDANAVFDATFTNVDGTKDCVGESFSNDLIDGKYGCWIGSAALNGLGRFRPAFFQTEVKAACEKGAFTYSGQPFANVKITACAGTTNCTTTRNYDFSRGWARGVTLSNAGETSNFEKRNNVGTNVVPATAFSLGIAGLNDVTYKFPEVATPETNLVIRATDDEGVSSAGHDEGKPLLRSGRLKLDGGVGSESLSLPLKATAQYYASATLGWATNTNDVCTTLRTSALPIHSSDSTTAPCRLYGEGVPLSCALPTASLTAQQAGILVNNPVTPRNARAQMTVSKSFPKFSDANQTQKLDTGIATFRMTAPGIAGSLGVTLLVPDFLKYNGNFPTATATFGIYKGVKGVIHIREQY